MYIDKGLLNENKNKGTCVFSRVDACVCEVRFIESTDRVKSMLSVRSAGGQKHLLKLKGPVVTDTGVISAVDANVINERHTAETAPEGVYERWQIRFPLLNFTP